MIAFAVAHPAMAWLAIAAILLAIEVAIGAGWLLWASGSAAAVSVAVLVVPMGPPIQFVLFAVLAAASSLLGRRLWPPRAHGADDINDNAARVLGRHARVVAAFEGGRGRVAIDGKEWAAVLVAGAAPATGDSVEVTAASGAELSVRNP